MAVMTVMEPRIEDAPRPLLRDALPEPPALPSHEQIARRAYELYEDSGHDSGRDVEFWLEAERELMAKA